jgi:hypothetical protein
MQYNFRGQYDSTQSYAVSDVVSYTINGITKYYYCLSPNDNTSPQYPSNSDTSYWGIINALSNFPNSVDSFIYRVNIQAQDKADIDRINQLTLQTTLSSDEQTELNNLISKHRNKLFLADDLNAIQDSLSNMQLFFKDKIESYVNSNVNSITTATNNALAALDAKKASIDLYMDSTTAGAIRTDLGVMSDLTTTDKSSLVNAINEVNAKPSYQKPANGIPKTDLDSSVQTSLSKADTAVQSSDYVSHSGYAVTTNSGNAYSITLTPAPTSYVDGMSIRIKVNADATGATTLNVNGLGAKSLLNSTGNNVSNLKANGIYTFVYNATTGNFILQGEGSDPSSLITAANGILGS